MSLAAIIHALVHGPDTFSHKSFCAARSACMSPIPCSVSEHVTELNNDVITNDTYKRESRKYHVVCDLRGYRSGNRI